MYAYERFAARPTLDIDFLGNNISNEGTSIIAAFKEICSVPFEEDGVVFDVEHITAQNITEFKELDSDYLITLETAESNDEMTVEVELSQLFTDDYGRLQALTREITRQLKDEILVTPRVKLVPKGALPKSEGKAVRVKDLRKTF